MGKKIFLFLVCLSFGILKGIAQVTTIRGTVVTDEDGSPVIGASILVKGEKQGAVSDMDGKFELKIISSSATTRLVVSYMGLATQVI